MAIIKIPASINVVTEFIVSVRYFSKKINLNNSTEKNIQNSKL